MPLLLALALAHAADTPLDRHLELAAEAARAEREGDFARAEALCVEAVDVLPDGPRTARCRERVAFLEARRDPDGGFAGWTALERARAARRTLPPDEVRARVQEVLTAEGIGELVRAEAALWLALDDLDRRDDPDGAVRHTGSWVGSGGPGDPAVRRLLVTTHARALARLGRAEEARAVQEEVRVAAPSRRPTPVDLELARRREAAVTRASLGVLAVFAAVTAFLGRWARPAGPPWGLLVLGVTGGATWWLTESWDAGAGAAVPWLLLGTALVHLLAAAALGATSSRTARLLVRALALGATLAVSWLALWGTGTLQWVGL